MNYSDLEPPSLSFCIVKILKNPQTGFYNFEIMVEDGDYLPSSWGYWKKDVVFGDDPSVFGYFVLCIEYEEGEENAIVGQDTENSLAKSASSRKFWQIGSKKKSKKFNPMSRAAPYLKKFTLDVWSTEPINKNEGVVDKRKFAFYDMQSTMFDSWSSELCGGNHTSPNFYLNPQYMIASRNDVKSNVFIKLETDSQIPVGLYLIELQGQVNSLDRLPQKSLKNAKFNKAFMFHVNTLYAVLDPGKTYLIVCSTLEENEVSFPSIKTNFFSKFFS